MNQFHFLEVAASARRISGQLKYVQDVGITHVLHRFEQQTKIPDGNLANQSQFSIDSELKMFFQNEMHATHVPYDQSDDIIAR